MKKKSIFFLFSATVLLFILIIENINQRFWLNDFKVYYLAADAFLSGDPVYGVPFGLGTGFYKYSPVLLYIFAPFTLIPFEAAAIIQYLLTSLSAIGVIIAAYQLSTRFWKREKKSVSLLLSLCFIAILNHLFRELHLGNVNMILVFVLLTCLEKLLKGKHVSAGVLFVIACLFKPYFVLLGLPLLLHKKWKMIGSAVAGIIILLLFLSLVTGFTDTVNLHRQWLASMASHSELLASSHTILSLLAFYFDLTFSDAIRFVPVVLTAALYCIIAFKQRPFIKNDPGRSNDQLIFSFLVLLALLPNLLITDTEHFLFSLPLIVFCITGIFELEHKPLAVPFVIIILMHGTNSPDLYGSRVSEIIEKAGILGLANLLLITYSVFLFTKRTETIDNTGTTSPTPIDQS